VASKIRNLFASYTIRQRWGAPKFVFVSSPNCPDRLREPPQATCLVGTGVVSRGLKQPGSYADQSPSSSDVKNEWSHASTPAAMSSLQGQGKLHLLLKPRTSVERSTLVPYVQMTNGLGPAFNKVAGEQCCFMARCLLSCPKMLLLLL
jgi:hypothetical protein